MRKATQVVFTGPGEVGLESHELDDSGLGPTEALVSTRTTVISPGTELAWLHGRPLRYDGPPEPFGRRPGYANVGTVVAAGAEAGVEEGERVYSMSRHCSLVRVDTQRQLLVPVPPEVPDDEAPFVRLATVSMTTLVTTAARPGDEVTVVGLGLVGNLAAQVFAICGYRTSAVDLSAARRERARACGLTVYGPDETEPLRGRQRLVVEATGSAKAQADAVRLAADGGEVVMVGAPWGGASNSVPSGMLTSEVFLRFLRLRSGSEWEIPILPVPRAPGSIQQNTQTAYAWMAAGRLRAAPLISHRLPPDRAGEAYDGLANNPDDYLGVVLQWPGQ